MGTLRQASKILSLFEDTPDNQIQDVLASGLLADLRDGNIAGVKRDEFRKLLGLKPLNPPLLKRVGTVAIAAITSPFIAREKFVMNTGANIRYIGNNFSTWFSAKVEEPMSEATLCYAKLLRNEVDGPIMDELGDAKETTLAEIYALIQRQANGNGKEKEGVLLTNGRANIFYVLDANGTLRAVYVIWYGDGWHVSARSVTRPSRWCDGGQVFSRNS